jgi:hypothetical protein
VKILSNCFPAMVCVTATSRWKSLQVTTCGALLLISSSLKGLGESKGVSHGGGSGERSPSCGGGRGRGRVRYLQRRRTCTLTDFSLSCRDDMVDAAALGERGRGRIRNFGGAAAAAG